MSLRSKIRGNSSTAIAGLAAIAFTLPAPAFAQQQTYSFEIPASNLADALARFGRATRQQLVYNGGQARQARSGGVRGTMSAGAALSQLLQGTGFSYRVGEAGVMIIERNATSAVRPPAAVGGRQYAAADRQDQSGTPRAGEVQAGSAAANSESAEILVTGSRIRGGTPSSQVTVVTANDIRNAGQNDLGEVFRSLPQNFSGGQNPAILAGATAGSDRNSNVTGGSSLNLRGLGPDATLTLLNGTRLPYDGYYQATDVANIPVAAISRVEILLDGASAVYGSDAVGGVANIILKRDFEGADLSARYGFATDGGNRQQQYSAVLGHQWSTGGLLLASEYSRNTPTLAQTRSYLDGILNPREVILPAQWRAGGMITGHQRINDNIEFEFDTFYSRRNTESERFVSTTNIRSNISTETYGFSPAMRFDLGDNWSTRIGGFIGVNNSRTDRRNFNAAGTQTFFALECFCYEAMSLNLEAEGPVFDLPGGQARISFGGGFSENAFNFRDRGTSNLSTNGTRRNLNGFAEGRFPLIGPAQDIPLVRSLTVNAALRFDDYNDIGNALTPRIGVRWDINDHLALRGTWGRSFKAPTLYELNSPTQVILYPTSLFPTVGAPAGSTLLIEGGGNDTLRPERAQTWSVGAMIRPPFVSGLQVEANWFRIVYRDRVAIPTSSIPLALSNAIFSDLVVRNPTQAQQSALIGAADSFTTLTTYDPARVFAIVSLKSANISATVTTGVDLSARYQTNVGEGRLSLDANFSWLNTDRRLTARAPETPGSGVVYLPAEFRARGGLTWSQDAFSISTHVNRISGVINNQVTPAESVDGMTTFDLVVDARLSFITRETRLRLSAINMFDAGPPLMRRVGLGPNYDSTNYSGVGRVISLAITQRF